KIPTVEQTVVHPPARLQQTLSKPGVDSRNKLQKPVRHAMNRHRMVEEISRARTDCAAEAAVKEAAAPVEIRGDRWELAIFGRQTSTIDRAPAVRSDRSVRQCWVRHSPPQRRGRAPPLPKPGRTRRARRQRYQAPEICPVSRNSPAQKQAAPNRAICARPQNSIRQFPAGPAK